jgi:hypothetical protein
MPESDLGTMKIITKILANISPMSDFPLLWYTVYFTDCTDVDVQADSLEEAEQTAHEVTKKEIPVDRIIPHEIESTEKRRFQFLPNHEPL